MLTIILTSYNRPKFLDMALSSLLAQTDHRWKCYIMDDNSNMATRNIIAAYSVDPRFVVRFHDTTEYERQATTRYSVLINKVLPELKSGIVGYMCDNVEYEPSLVDEVLHFFRYHPGIKAAYVPHERDAYTLDGQRLGEASYFRHWNQTPPIIYPITQPAGQLDHSQVFHRLPTSIRWSEDPRHKKAGDADFFSRLVAEYGPIVPVTDDPLTVEHLFS